MQFLSVVLGLVSASFSVIPVSCHFEYHNNHHLVEQDDYKHDNHHHRLRRLPGLTGILKDRHLQAGGKHWNSFVDWARSTEFVAAGARCSTVDPPSEDRDNVDTVVRTWIQDNGSKRAINRVQTCESDISVPFIHYLSE